MADVLLIEDDLDTRTLMERWLQKDGHRVVSASTAERALELLAASSFDLAVLDVRLPGMSGLELARRLREDESSRLVILMSSITDEEDLSSGDAGRHWLTKPFERHELLTAVTAALEAPRD